jgi:hypothetical protein
MSENPPVFFAARNTGIRKAARFDASAVPA